MINNVQIVDQQLYSTVKPQYNKLQYNEIVNFSFLPIQRAPHSSNLGITKCVYTRLQYNAISLPSQLNTKKIDGNSMNTDDQTVELHVVACECACRIMRRVT